jgi:hypothetical protein
VSWQVDPQRIVSGSLAGPTVRSFWVSVVSLLLLSAAWMRASTSARNVATLPVTHSSYAPLVGKSLKRLIGGGFGPTSLLSPGSTAGRGRPTNSVSGILLIPDRRRPYPRRQARLPPLRAIKDDTAANTRLGRHGTACSTTRAARRLGCAQAGFALIVGVVWDPDGVDAANKAVVSDEVPVAVAGDLALYPRLV